MFCRLLFRLLVLLSLLHLLLSLQLLAPNGPTIVKNPSSRTIYIPPRAESKDLNVSCSTPDPANITFESAHEMTEKCKSLVKSMQRQVTDRETVLTIKPVNSLKIGCLTNGGLFVCQARDLKTLRDNATNPFEFKRGEKPTDILDHSPTSNQISLQQPVSLSCSIRARIVPLVLAKFIYQKGQNQSEPKNFTKAYVQGGNLLKISLDVEGQKEDNGTYLCIFYNVFGEVSVAMDVIVTYLGNISVSINPPSRRVVEHDNVSILVQVDCNPAPLGITISHNNAPKIMSVANTKELDYVFEAKRTDTGRYTVRVIHVSENATRVLDLTVLSSPSMVHFFVVTVTHNSVTYNWTIGIDGNADITKITLCCGENENDVSQNQCSTSAKSRETDVLTAFHSSDTLEGLRPNTTYYCELFAMNEVGETPTGFPQKITTKATVPSKPNIISCISRHETSLTVNWTTFNGSSTIFRYIIRYQVIGNIDDWTNETQTEGISQSEGSITLTELKKQTEYTIEVAADNSVGRSLFGRNENGQCLTTCDLLVPIELNGTSTAIKGGYALQLKAEDKCGNVTEFVSKSCTENPLRTTFRQLSSRTFWVNVTGLETGQRCIMIKATTDSGISSKYGIFEVHAEQVPLKVNTVVVIIVSIAAFVLVVVIIVVLVCRRCSSQGSFSVGRGRCATDPDDEIISETEKDADRSTFKNEESPNTLAYAQTTISSE